MERSADKWIKSQFSANREKSDGGDQTTGDESEFHIIRINHKKQLRRPETRQNRLQVPRPALAVQIVSQNESADGWTTTTTPPNAVFGPGNNNSVDGGVEGQLADYSDTEGDEEDAETGDVDGRPSKGKFKNGHLMGKKYAPLVAAADPKGTGHRIYSRWSKWSKCSAK